MLGQPSGLSTVSKGNFIAAFFVEADLAARGVKIIISMPASSSTDFSHLARVSLEAGLYGFDVVINKQFMLPLSGLVTTIYCLNSFTEQIFVFSYTGICIFIDCDFFHMELNTSSF